ncbi:MAG: hypothetical protein KJ955_00270 [Nanoarchaeota archaeon]|nr:hypothetical protein [Nanoarchaeota archaeon]
MTANPCKSRIMKESGEILEAHFHNGFHPAKDIIALKAEGLEVITAMELAEARIASKDIPPVVREIWSPQFNCVAGKIRAPGSPILTDMFFLAENFNYMLNGDILVASREYSPILRFPEKAQERHKYGKEFYLDDAIVNELMAHAETDPKKAIKSGVLRIQGWRGGLADRYFMELPTMYLAGYPLAQFLFRNFAGPYGRFLNSLGETSIPVAAAHSNYATRQEKPFARPLVMGHIDYPELDGDNEDVYNGYHSILYGSVCGMRRIHGANAQ